jgi:hypothetical protein
MPEIKTELWRRTVGEGSDLYAGHESPWSESMDAYRAFTDSETRDPATCSRVDCTDDSKAAPLTAKEKQARKKIIARIASHYQPEYIRPSPRGQTTPIPPDTPLTLEPTKVKQLINAFEELSRAEGSGARPTTDSSTGTISFLRYPRATLAHRFPTARTARLELISVPENAIGQ